jgi:hypothetical protein
MRKLVILIFAIGTVWVIDQLAFERRYSDAAWREANYQGQLFNYKLKHWLRNAGL